MGDRSAGDPAVRGVLSRAHRLGFVTGGLDEHVAHALAFATAVDGEPASVADLGSGGGLPALVLAVHWTGSRWVLIERSTRRAAFLQGAVDELGLRDRVQIEAHPAEDIGRSAWRGTFDLVTARGFGLPAVTAECAAPLLRRGGRLVVSEPPGGDAERWQPVAASGLGMAVDRVVVRGPATLAVLHQHLPAPDWAPRRSGLPARRPLWT